jgi:non-ribosomal peptide synthetase component F
VGGCYVPVDPQYPKAYIEQILGDATPQVVLGKRGRADGVRVDMVRLLADGALEYLGRRDYEIKVRGHRVDVRQVERRNPRGPAPHGA